MITEAQSKTEARMYRKLAKQKPAHFDSEIVWRERLTLMAAQVRNLFRAEIAGDMVAADNIRRSLKDNAKWLEGILRKPRLINR